MADPKSEAWKAGIAGLLVGGFAGSVLFNLKYVPTKSQSMAVYGGAILGALVFWYAGYDAVKNLPPPAQQPSLGATGFPSVEAWCRAIGRPAGMPQCSRYDTA